MTKIENFYEEEILNENAWQVLYIWMYLWLLWLQIWNYYVFHQAWTYNIKSCNLAFSHNQKADR